MSKKTYVRFVLIHGWGGTRASLSPLASEIKSKLESLGKLIETHILEIPGFGETALPRVFDFDDYCNYFQREINSLVTNDDQETQLVLIGHSFGGKVILQLLGNGAFQNAMAILVNSSGLANKLTLKRRAFKILSLGYRPIKNALAFLRLNRLQQLLRKAAYKYIIKARDYEKITDDNLRETFKNVIAENISPEIVSRIENKVLLLWGEKDKDTPLWMGQKLNELIKRSDLSVVPMATHGLPLHQPALCAEKILDWVESPSK